jgi:formamidopyrimidine-DNA glycosylase
MPELPEVQAHAERLTTEFGGAVLSGFEPLAFTALKTFDPAPDAGVGSTLTEVRRRGKYLLLVMGDATASVTYVVHLMQGGRLRTDPKRTRRPRGGVARWLFGADHPGLLLTEAGTERKAGVWVVAGDPLDQEPLAGLGPEADTLDAAALHALFATHSARLHTFLRDQAVLAGIGRRLANEVCHRAGLSPFALTKTLDEQAAAAVVDAIRDAVGEGLEADRARGDMSSSAERPAGVHGRVGQACPACGDVVRAVEYRDYTVAYCPGCQTGGRILADNTTSKFLK